MDEFPAELLLDIVAILCAVIFGQIFVYRTQENHRDHAAEEEHNHERVQNAEPLNFRIRHRVKNVIPSRGPFDFIIHEITNRIRVLDFEIFQTFQVARYLQRLGALAVAIFHALYLHLHVNDASALVRKGLTPLFVRAIMVRYMKVNMIEYIVSVRFFKVRLYLYSIQYEVIK